MSRSIALIILGRVLATLFIMSIPLLLITISVTWSVNDLSRYRHGFDKYQISRVTGIENDGLMDAARQIRGYFNSTREPLDIKARIFGEEEKLFNERELLHMRDVKHLIWGVYAVGLAAAVYLLGFVGAGFFIHRRLFAHTLSRSVLWGSGLTLALVVLVGLAAMTGFDSMFLFFHKVSFANDFWKLDSRTDHLVMMFPQGFWLDATLFVALATVGQSIVVGGIAGGFLVFRRRQFLRRQELLLENVSKGAEV